MEPEDLNASAPADGSALDALLSRSVIWDRAGGALPRDLVGFGLLGASVIVGAGLLALMLPSPSEIRNGGFFLIAGGLAAGMGALLQALAAPLILGGLMLLALDIFLLVDQRARSDGWRSAVVGQAVAGGTGGLVSAIFLALVVFNIVLWAVIFTLAAVVVGAVVAALLSGAGG